MYENFRLSSVVRLECNISYKESRLGDSIEFWVSSTLTVSI